jgi:hypothetical protein
MADINKTIAAEIVRQLKEKNLIEATEASIEAKIATGTIKDTDWKLHLESQIRNLEKQAKNEAQ